VYFYPGKTKTYTRAFNKARALAFVEKQFDLFGDSATGARVPPPYNNRGTRISSDTKQSKSGVLGL